MTESRPHAVVVGAGPVGCVLAVLLARRGFAVSIYEKRTDMRLDRADGGRSINLVLTRRGLRALELLGLREAVLHLTVPVLGRMMHAIDGTLSYQPYGKDDSECNYSVSRGKLNEFLLDAAEREGCQIHFEHELVDADFDERWLRFRTDRGDFEVAAAAVFGADGGGSAVRRALVDNHGAVEEVSWLRHGYKEMLFAGSTASGTEMAGHALHIWPRGDHMLMGLANLDGSFTGTSYLANEGPRSFAELDNVDVVDAFFAQMYPDAGPLLVDGWQRDFVEAPTGHLGTVWCAPWHYQDRVLLVGDAAHAIVPFFGQGLNCGFEDCSVLWELTADGADLATVFDRFFALRKANADAIADMALENFVEMRDKVGDARFLLEKAIERRIEAEHADIYRSRYATVMYSHNPYRVAYDAGAIQAGILAELAEGVQRAEDVDLDAAVALIAERLTPFYDRTGVDLTF